MAGKRRSGFAKYRKAYACHTCQVTPTTYTFTYNGNTNTSGNAPIDGFSPYASGSSVTFLGNSGSPALAKTGFTFDGWNTEANGSGTSYSQGNTITLTENTILYAQWTLITYTITYNGNTNTSGNAPIDVSSPYVSGSNVTFLGNSGSPILAKTGFTFDGWNTEAKGSGTSYSQGNTFTINANTTLYAQWTPVVVGASFAPTLLYGVGGNQAAYILFTQTGSVTNYEYSTDDGATFLLFDPPQIFSPVEINTLSSDGTTRLTNETIYNVKLKAVSSGGTTSESNSVSVTPTITSLLSSNRIIYLDANNSSSYSGSGTTWTNLELGGAYSATLNGSPTFDNTTYEGNNYFNFNPGSITGQFAQINQALAINPTMNLPFTIQMWVRINNIGSQGSLVSKVFGPSSYDGYALGYKANTSLELHQNGAARVNYFSSNTGVLINGWALYTANVQFGNGGLRTNNIFVNGRQVLTATSNEIAIPSNNENLTFPKGFYGEGKCDISQFYYYTAELSPTQIIQNYDATKPPYI
jgi:uncharacterized repeat protein (TIGR02543 family)